ncbi:hypothetical protein KJB62_12655 [Staphylococcus saprophyticus]|uniref:hypothetical protein n=1 Tax=Staphylococcus saprophyticus TaxID=29385 RepID=UPI001F2C4682|nr:hypothetical protein [Staphylococcus saprophyticus]MCE5132218.1 hypothetical protein [Staphylococcus saprophyticus]
MHSKIIYLIENENKFTNSFGGHLPLEYLITNETLFEHITESDYIETNYMNNDEDYNLIDDLKEICKEVFIDSEYFDFKEDIYEEYVVSINRNNLINWDKRFLELNEKYSDKIKSNLSQNEFTTNCPFDTFKEYYEYQEMTGKDLGGYKFAIYRDIGGELDFDTVLNINDLICYAKSDFGLQNKENFNKENIEFQVCTNVLGDYHI